MSSAELNEIVAVCKSRQKIYSFLSRMFEKEMTDDLLKQLQRGAGGLSGMEALKELDNKKLNEGLSLLEDYLTESSRRNMKDVITELAVEYAGLFLSVWGTPAHPSESVYASGGTATMQKERDEVLEMYTAEGVDKVKEFTEPEDHIALELQFISYLSDKTAKAAGKADLPETERLLEVQRSFLDKHLGKWIGSLAKDVLKQGRIAFYKGTSLMAEGFVEEDAKSLVELVDGIRS